MLQLFFGGWRSVVEEEIRQEIAAEQHRLQILKQRRLGYTASSPTSDKSRASANERGSSMGGLARAGLEEVTGATFSVIPWPESALHRPVPELDECGLRDGNLGGLEVSPNTNSREFPGIGLHTPGLEQGIFPSTLILATGNGALPFGLQIRWCAPLPRRLHRVGQAERGAVEW